jgi:mRNA-degrading endonuclease RelE of RelBE toxin-antitoxin system
MRRSKTWPRLISRSPAGSSRLWNAFAGTGAGDVKKLRGISPPEYRLRVGDYRIRFDMEGEAIRVLRVRNRREAYR